MITIMSVFPPYRGGIATFSDYLYKHLSKKTEVEAYNFSALYPGILFPGKSQFIDNPASFDAYAKTVLHSWNPLKWKSAYKSILSNTTKHFIICYWHPFFSPVYLRLIKYARKKRPDLTITILTHNVIPHERFPFGKWLSKSLMDSTDKVIVLSEKSKKECIRLGIQSPVTKLFHPVYSQDPPTINKAELRTKYGIPEDSFVPLFFGLIRPYKGVDIFIEAINAIDLNIHKIHPVIAGEFYSDKDELISRINSDQKNNYRIIDRFVSDEEMAELFTLSDVLVMPYKSASQSGILANAINFQLPAIVSDLEGLTEHLEHNKTGWILPQNDPEELSKAITELNEQDLLPEMSEALGELNEVLSWDSFTNKVLSAINSDN